MIINKMSFFLVFVSGKIYQTIDERVIESQNTQSL